MTYTGLAFPKPKARKGNSHKAKNNPVPTIDQRCYFTGKPYAECHEVFFGTGQRQLSIQYGMQIYLAPELHRIGTKAVHNNREFDLQLKRMFQKKFEKEHSREEFVKIFGRNYLD